MSTAFEPVTKLQGRVLPLDRASVDTDALMPKQYLKSISRTGYGDWLFDDWRYLDAGDVETATSTRRINPDFILNEPRYKDVSILLTRENFGCGSSREHAVWGLRDYGIRVVLAPSFADIFYNNCFNNGLLPAIVAPEDIDQLFARANGAEALELTVDLVNQVIAAGDLSVPFAIEPARRSRLMAGLDAIGVALTKADKIKAFEANRMAASPWIYAADFTGA